MVRESVSQLEELERSSYDDMVSIPSPGLHLNTSQLASDFRQRIGSNSSSSLSPNSPNSWKNSLEELSRGLQRICNSPSKELNGSLQSPISRNRNCTMVNRNESLKRQTSHNLQKHGTSLQVPTDDSISALPSEKCVIRVRHEESCDNLQKRLSQISGLKASKANQFYNNQRKPSKDLAMLVARRRSSLSGRLNIVVNVEDTPHENITVKCHRDELVVSDIAKITDNNEKRVEDIHKESLPNDTQVNRIMCVHSDNELHIRERSSQVVNLEMSRSASDDAKYCPVFAWENDGTLWKMSWYLEDKYANQNISVKTVDSKLVIVCRSKRLSMLMDHVEQSQDLIRNAFNHNGPVAMKYRGGIQLTVDLPEGVDARSVTASISDENQILIQGRQSILSDRCMTL